VKLPGFFMDFSMGFWEMSGNLCGFYMDSIEYMAVSWNFEWEFIQITW